jgi:PST family polysaccharide transporter
MAFRRLVLVRLLSTIFSVMASVTAALAGWGYWALVMQPVALALSASAMFWIALPWVPGPPRRCEGLRGMLGFGGALTAHGMVGYLANNLDNILIGRLWGGSALGVYSTSYGIMMRPISLAGYGVGEAAIPALSRAADSPSELKATFRRMFELTCLLGLPICMAGALWTEDIVLGLLGNQWVDAIPVLRLLFVAALPRMLGVSTGWVYVATGRPGRMLSWQLGWTPFIVLSFVLGVSFGAVGVAAAYAIANWVGMIPNYLYCFAGTPIHLRDIGTSLVRPLACTTISLALGTLLPLAATISVFHSAGIGRLSVRLLVAGIAYALVTAMFIPFIHDKAMIWWRRVVARPERI